MVVQSGDNVEFYEKTIQYNHPMKERDFYSKEVNGRFRVRITKNDDIEKCMITWKKRLNEVSRNEINKEEEIEVRIDSRDYDNLIQLLTGVVGLVRVESYERYRHVFRNNEIEIVVDGYPFGVALKIESKTDEDRSEEEILKWLDKLGLDVRDSYKLFGDDKYNELCRKQKKEVFKAALFGLDMPMVK